MLITDAQVHVWGASTPQYPMVGKPHRTTPLSPEQLLREMKVAGVDRVVMIPPTWQGFRNDIALNGVRLAPDRLAIMGRLDISAPDAREQLKHWREQPGMMGIRLARDQQVTVDGSQHEVLSTAEQCGVPLMLNSMTWQLGPVHDVAQRYPGLKLSIDHLGVPKGTKDEGAFADLNKLLALAKYPNVSVKATSLPCYTEDRYPYTRLHPYLRRVYDAFGPKRIFWGTDFTKLPCPYRDVVTMFTEEMAWLSDTDKEWIMGRALCEWLDWK